MSNTNADFLLLLDKSGSMSGVRATTVKGVDEFIESIAEASKENGITSTVSIITFDDKVDVDQHLMNRDPATFGSISSHYQIRGGTAIYDAIGVGISGFEPKSGNVVIALFTDGGEYNSHTYNQTSAAALVKTARKSKWTVAYICPQSYGSEFAKGINIPEGNGLGYEAGNTGTRTAFSKLGRAAERYLSNLKKGEVDSKTFFSGLEKNSVMNIKKMQVVLNMPRALKSKKDGETEISQELPPYAPVDAYVVDESPSCPSSWMNGSSKASSYFVGVKPDRGMWLDFNGCDKEHDVAAVISVQGINPITGLKSDALRLERYENKCPKHNCDFKQDRFCEECGYKWPAQNYLSTTSTPDGQFWLDGFRSEDGKIRQYIFTEEMARGVANAVIGNDKVYAVGIAFFKSKKAKPVPAIQEYYTNGMMRGVTKCCSLAPSAPQAYYSRSNTKGSYGGPRGQAMGGGGTQSMGFIGSVTLGKQLENTFRLNASVGGGAGAAAEGAVACCATADMADTDTDSLLSYDSFEALSPKSFEVGAGAAVDQKIHEDKESLDYWEDKPVGMVYINYTDFETVEKILKAGKRAEKKDGFLAAVPVGN